LSPPQEINDVGTGVMMKIVQAHGTFFPVTGGVANYIYNLCKELVKRGHDVTVLTSTFGTNKKVGVEELEGIKIRRLNHAFRLGGTPIIPSLPLELNRISADIIHTHLPSPYISDLACFFSKRRGIPCVLTYHNDIVSNGMLSNVGKFYNATALKSLLSNVDRIIIHQPRCLNYSPYLPKFKYKIEVIPCGVEVDKFRPLGIEKRENSISFLSILNKYHKYKGLDYLLKALTLVKKEIKDVKLMVGGEGELIEYYKGMVKSLDLESNVEFRGFVPQEELVEYYNRSRVFVLPSISSRQEGFGIVLLEALACGTPVITTDIVGVAKDVEANNAGIIVQPNDIEALAEALVTVLRDENLSAEMGRNGRKVIEEKYTWEKVIDAVITLYEELASK